jgi:hypothetical protein
MPTTITPEQLRLAAQLLEDLPVILARLGEDGRRVQAFYNDYYEAISSCLTDPEAAAKLPVLLQIPTALMAEVALAQKKFAWYKPATWDVFKSMRGKAKSFAEALNFKKYLAELANGQS